MGEKEGRRESENEERGVREDRKREVVQNGWRGERGDSVRGGGKERQRRKERVDREGEGQRE